MLLLLVNDISLQSIVETMTLKWEIGAERITDLAGEMDHFLWNKKIKANDSFAETMSNYQAK